MRGCQGARIHPPPHLPTERQSVMGDFWELPQGLSQHVTLVGSADIYTQVKCIYKPGATEDEEEDEEEEEKEEE